MGSFQDFSFLDYVTSTVDIVVVWLVFYQLLKIVRGTKAVQLLKGFILILAIQFVSGFFGLTMLKAITDELITWGFLAIIIIFQPELRKALEELGRAKFFSRSAIEAPTALKNIEQMMNAIKYMAKRRIGALITIERENGLANYINTGTAIHGEISSELLTNIFMPNSPLHDGAVIIAQEKIAAAGCYLPLSEEQTISKELGTRHRAAIGMSESTDSVTMIVSEETGDVSLAMNGILYRSLSFENLESKLKLTLIREDEKPLSFWKWGGKKDG